MSWIATSNVSVFAFSSLSLATLALVSAAQHEPLCKREMKWRTPKPREVYDEALVAAASISNRYFTDRFLPEKAVDLVDEAVSAHRRA